MSVGNSTIDAQHKKLVLQLNKVVDSMLLGIASDEVFETLNYFEKYIEDHFAYEENYLRQRGYKDLEGHKNMHRDFRDKFEALKYALNSSSTPAQALPEIERSLARLLIEHVKYEDRKYHKNLGAGNIASAE
jgi:hemerythrin